MLKQLQLEKQQEKKRREAILDRIKNERQERNAKMLLTKPAPITPTSQEKLPTTVTHTSNTSRPTILQIRMEEGKLVKCEFPSDSDISVVYQHVKTLIKKENNEDQVKSFTLLTPFPRKELPENSPITLSEAGLTPSGTLVVLYEETRGILKTAQDDPDYDPILRRVIRPPPTYNSDDDSHDEHMSYEQMLELEERVGNVGRGLSLEHLSTLPIHLVTADCHLQNEICLVCQSEYVVNEQIRTLPCLHVFHQICIDKWLGTQTRCPICNRRVDDLIERGTSS